MGGGLYRIYAFPLNIHTHTHTRTHICLDQRSGMARRRRKIIVKFAIRRVCPKAKVLEDQVVRIEVNKVKVNKVELYIVSLRI